MSRYIDANALYEKTAEWEAQALEQVSKYDPRDSREEWRWWSAVLKERSAFKFDVADAPTADVRENKRGRWQPIQKGDSGYSAGDFACSCCGKPNRCYSLTDYCCNCGADMRGEEDEIQGKK